MKPFEIYTQDVKTPSGTMERATFTANAYCIGVRRWCKTCQHFVQSTKLGTHCCRDNHAITNARGCCDHYKMEEHFAAFGSPELQQGKIKSPRYFKFINTSLSTLMIQWDELPVDLRKTYASFMDYVHQIYEELTRENVYGERLTV